MDSESTKADTAGAGPDMRKALASVIITEKATAEPRVVMNALIRCLQVPEVGLPAPSAAPLSQATVAAPMSIHHLALRHLLARVQG